LTAAQQSKQQSKSKPATVMAKRHKTPGKLLIFLQQAKWRLRHKGFNIAGKLTLCTASPSGLGQQGQRHHGQAVLFDHKPSRISQRGMTDCGQAASQAPAVSATKGTRHHRQALMVAVMQKGDYAKKWPQQEIFFAGKATAYASTLILNLT
jgi:hypothetical protein